MKLLISFFMLTFFINLPVQAKIALNSCKYYEQLEKKMKCGEGSYVNEFALPYCSAYLAKQNEFTPLGQVIMTKIRYCLQTSLFSQSRKLTCDNIEELGLSSHESCYIKSGFCDLEAFDKMQVMWVARSEILNPRMWMLMSDINNSCLIEFAIPSGNSAN